MPAHKKQVHNHGLGKAIMNHRAKSQVKDRERELHTTEIYDNKPISVTQETDLENFLNTATLAGTEFKAERQNVIILPSLHESSSATVSNNHNNLYINSSLLTIDQQLKLEHEHKLYQNLLQVPRRPQWKTKDEQNQDQIISPHQLERLERDSFLIWRKNLSELTDHKTLLLTPFEKNLEIWRQLWRVIERSEIILQIVDARDPLKFRCQDLEKYVNELNDQNQNSNPNHPNQNLYHKKNLLLINKSDLLSESQRELWAEYLIGEGIEFAFFSALESADTKEGENDEDLGSEEPSADHHSHSSDDRDDEDEEEDDADDDEEDDDDAEDDDEDEEEDGGDEEEDGQEAEPSLNKRSSSDNVIKSTQSTSSLNQDQRDIPISIQDHPLPKTLPIEESIDHLTFKSNRVIDKKLTKVLTVDELEEFFVFHSNQIRQSSLSTHHNQENNTHEDHQDRHHEKSSHQTQPFKKIVIGLVGYPNVGKSSTINSLLKSKKVSVSITPGKTKHFQTIHLSSDIILCDCPGLVFPEFTKTKAELICDGILPIDQMKDYINPIRLLLQRIPIQTLELNYGIHLNQEDHHEPQHVDAHHFLSTLANARGFFTGGSGQSRPDESKAARMVLKDYIKAKLLYCHPPPLDHLRSDEFNLIGHPPSFKHKKAPLNRVPLKSNTYFKPTNDLNKTKTIDQTFFKSIPSHQNANAPIPELQFKIKGRQIPLLNHPSKFVNHPIELEKSKKHFKGQKRSGRMKMRSGKGYDEF